MPQPEIRECFHCDEESRFYGECVAKLVLSSPEQFDCLVELGSGDGTPIISALHTINPSKRPIIHGYETNPCAYQKFVKNIEESDLKTNYVPHQEPFFDATLPDCSTLISNPPYLPHHNGDFPCSYLWGGQHGNEVSQHLLELKVPHVMLIVSSYSDPLALLEYAQKLGYRVVDFLIHTIPFGPYSKEPEVLAQIQNLHQQGKAYLQGEQYYITGVLFSHDSSSDDKNSSLIKSLTTF